MATSRMQATPSYAPIQQETRGFPLLAVQARPGQTAVLQECDLDEYIRSVSAAGDGNKVQGWYPVSARK